MTALSSLTLVQMRTRVRRVLRDADGSFISDGEIDDLLNEAQLEIAARTLSIQKNTTGTFTTYQLALPADYLAVTSLRVGSELEDVEWVDDATWDSWSRSESDPPRSIARVFANNFEVYPSPDSGTAYTLRYARTPTLLSGDSDVPEVVMAYQHNMIHYAQAYSKLKDGETGEHEAYLSMFRENLPETSGPTTNYKPGPFTIRFEAGPFDTPDAAHI